MVQTSNSKKRRRYLGAVISGILAVSMLGQTTELRASDPSPGKKGLSVMVLGSGGPAATAKGRASAGYLVFADGQPTIVMDIGGGDFQRLAKSGVNVKDLDIVLLSHLHIDHTGDLSSLIKTIYFHNTGAGTTREAPINIYGPGSNGVTFPNTTITQYPSSIEYMDNHYTKANNIEHYLNNFTQTIQTKTFTYTTTDLAAD